MSAPLDETGPAAYDDFGPVDHLPLTRIQQIGASRLHAAWTGIPHVTHFDEADVTLVDAERRRLNADRPSAERLTLLAWVARACVLALVEHPRFCASLDLEQRQLVLKRYVNLGIAVDSAAGLLVGVVAGAQHLSLTELAAAIGGIAERARAGKLKPAEMEGSCFTISSLGNLGGTGFTPIINPPNVAILGVSLARLRPACIDGRIEPRLSLPLSLSYDHRALNGADAARFCNTLVSHLSQAHH